MKIKNKLLNLEQIKKRIQIEKDKNKKIILCHGVFDVLHFGHIKHFRR